MKKILFVITKSNWGGAQRYVFDLASGLPKDQFDVSVALGGAGGKDAAPGLLEQKLREKNIETVFVQSFMRNISLVKEFKAFAELSRMFRARRPDVVHLNSSKAGGIGALAARAADIKKIVFTSHGLPHDEDRDPLSKAGIWLATWLTFLLCTDAIVISNDNLKRAKRFPFCSKKIRLVHNGIGQIAFFEKAEARTKLDIQACATPSVAHSRTVIGAIANLEWNKGLHYLVRAAGILKRAGKDFLIYIIGEGEERQFLQTLIEEEDVATQVRLAGFKEYAALYAKAFDVFVLPSVKEGLPYVLLEAGQAGLPAVATNVGGVGDIIGDGVSGLLVKPKNHHDLADKLKTLIDDLALRERYGAALKQRVDQEFSLEQMVVETKKIYTS